MSDDTEETERRAERALKAIAEADPNASRGLAAAIAELGVTPSTALPPLEGKTPAARWGVDARSRKAFGRLLEIAEGRHGIERHDGVLVFSVPAHQDAGTPEGARDMFQLGIVEEHLDLVGLGRRPPATAARARRAMTATR